MKNLKLSYALFGVFLLIIIVTITCGDKTSSKGESHIEVLSFPNPEEVKEAFRETDRRIKPISKNIKQNLNLRYESLFLII